MMHRRVPHRSCQTRAGRSPLPMSLPRIPSNNQASFIHSPIHPGAPTWKLLPGAHTTPTTHTPHAHSSLRIPGSNHPDHPGGRQAGEGQGTHTRMEEEEHDSGDEQRPSPQQQRQHGRSTADGAYPTYAFNVLYQTGGGGGGMHDPHAYAYGGGGGGGGGGLPPPYPGAVGADHANLEALIAQHAAVPPPAPQQPIFVNPKQYERIMKRREARARLENHRRKSAAAARKPFLHESRHLHAVKRPRGPGGRFLTKEERMAWDDEQKRLQMSQSLGAEGPKVEVEMNGHSEGGSGVSLLPSRTKKARCASSSSS